MGYNLTPAVLELALHGFREAVYAGAAVSIRSERWPVPAFGSLSVLVIELGGRAALAIDIVEGQGERQHDC